MAHFNRERLEEIIARTPDPLPVVAIETGTWKGDTTALLAERFARVFTIDIDEKWVKAATRRFATVPNVDVVAGDSAKVLPMVLDLKHAPTLLYLDAHWWSGYGGFADRSPFPLWDEISNVIACPWVRVVVVDDIYQMGKQNDPNPGWPEATPERIIGAMGNRVTEHAVIGDQLVAWWNGVVVNVIYEEAGSEAPNLE